MASNITSVSKREKVISLWSSGYRNKEICSRLHLSHQTVSNILSKFLQNGTAAPGKPGWKERTVATPNVVEFVEYCKVFKPSTRTFEIQQGLLANAICTPANLPARSTISDIVRQDLQFTWKKLSRPSESLTHENLLKTLNYIMYMSGVDPSMVHFFDEISVVKTTPNRSYGHSKKRLPAVEIQRYASNCNYTVNLRHSRFGIDNFNILEGPSNGFEMIHFFQESLQAVDHVGNPVLANGDVIVMDNCGFHHRVFAENQLGFMLRNRGVELIFQPPYSPEFNSCKFCFRSMKAYLRQHKQFSTNFTELAIIQGLQTIMPALSQNIFNHCRFVFYKLLSVQSLANSTQWRAIMS